MSTKPRTIEKFDPTTDWAREELVNFYLIYLPDFRKEQVRVQLTPAQTLRISGERPIGDIKWKSFLKEVKLPDNCDLRDISARFEGGILKVKMPKLIIPADQVGPTIRHLTEMMSSPDKPDSVARALENAGPRGPVTENAAGIKEASKGQKHDEEKEPVKEKPDGCETKKKGIHETSKDKDMKRRDTVRPRGSRQVACSGGILEQLRKPQNFKKLMVVVLVMLVLVLHNAYVMRVCRRMEHPEL